MLYDNITKRYRKIKWVSVKSLSEWGSVDSKDNKLKRQLLPVLDEKGEDYEYSFALEFLKREGFTEPLVCIKKGGFKSHGDGHHRLAAAIDLGYKYIPYIFTKDEEVFIEDVGKWENEGTLIHPENPTPENPICKI